MIEVTIEQRDDEYVVTAITNRTGNYTSVVDILNNLVTVCHALKPHLQAVNLNIPPSAAGQLANLILLDLEE